jgi:hypothetical protein
MKKWWAKVRKFFKRPGAIKWTVIILSVVIIGGAIKALLWTIYTKDEPAFVPEEVREDIRGAIKESGEAIKTVSEPVGSAIVDAAFEKVVNTPEDPTANWPTYTDSATGISMKYPEGWGVRQNESVISFRPEPDSLSQVVIYTHKSINQEPDEWFLNRVDKEISDYDLLSIKHFDNIDFYVFKNKEGMEDVHYVGIINHTVLDVAYGGVDGYENVEKIISTIIF